MPEKANGFQNERHGNGAEEDYAAKLVVAAQAMERMMGGAGTNASAAPRPSDNAATLAAGAEASTVPIRHGTRNLLERVAPHIFRIDLPVPEELDVTNSYVVLGGKHNLVIDAGCNLPQTEEAFDEALSRLDVPWRATDVFLTHSDYDHCAGLTRIGRQGMIVYSGMEDYADRAKPALSCAPYTQAVERIGAEHDAPCNLDSDYWAPCATAARTISASARWRTATRWRRATTASNALPPPVMIRTASACTSPRRRSSLPATCC